jgi:hypothetical protein
MEGIYSEKYKKNAVCLNFGTLRKELKVVLIMKED